ncbi:MAG: alkaline phosphatase family protein [Prevotella sp.]|nr:alkaline phosphatase family protein [Prevotella sp.]
MRKAFLVLAVMLTSLMTSASVERPKLVVGLVVDQMRWDYLYYYYDQFGEGGLKRLVDEGFSCENTMINYVPTVTAIGHTSIFTGTTPALHGICGNNFRENGRDRYCCGDTTVHSVGSDSKAGQMSPRNMLSNTIGDQLRLATDFRSKVIGVALKDRAAIFPAGHAANAAYWFDNSVGHFITSTYYMEELPAWVKAFNEKNKTTPGEDQKLLPHGVALTFDMAEAVLDNEKMGQGSVTDMLTISISSTDAIAHQYGTRADITREAYMTLDRKLAHLLSLLDKRFGRDGYLLFLSADHAGAHNPNFLNEHHLPAGGWSASGMRKQANEALRKRFGVDRLIAANYGDFFYIDHAKVDSAALSLADVKAEAIRQLGMNDHLLAVIDCEQAATAPIPQLIRERIVNGYHRLRTGDIYCLPRANEFSWEPAANYKGTTHSEWNPYDAHIPLVFMGWHIQHGQTSQPTRIVDIAPTVCAMLHIQMPSACIGDAITEVVK